ncbi:hypothetical protein BDE02_05G181600 [Populus trichocarpa]|nr:hypothetical protein BDE02_05G181600 [Populus trichocarpa]
MTLSLDLSHCDLLIGPMHIGGEGTVELQEPVLFSRFLFYRQ